METEAQVGEVIYPSRKSGICTYAAWLQSLSSEPLYDALYPVQRAVLLNELSSSEWAQKGLAFQNSKPLTS